MDKLDNPQVQEEGKIDVDNIARHMGAKVKGEVEAGAGYFGALQLVAQVERRFRTSNKLPHSNKE